MKAALPLPGGGQGRTAGLGGPGRDQIQPLVESAQGFQQGEVGDPGRDFGIVGRGHRAGMCFAAEDTAIERGGFGQGVGADLAGDPGAKGVVGATGGLALAQRPVTGHQQAGGVLVEGVGGQQRLGVGPGAGPVTGLVAAVGAGFQRAEVAEVQPLLIQLSPLVVGVGQQRPGVEVEGGVQGGFKSMNIHPGRMPGIPLHQIAVEVQALGWQVLAQMPERLAQVVGGGSGRLVGPEQGLELLAAVGALPVQGQVGQQAQGLGLDGQVSRLGFDGPGLSQEIHLDALLGLWHLRLLPGGSIPQSAKRGQSFVRRTER